MRACFAMVALACALVAGCSKRSGVDPARAFADPTALALARAASAGNIRKMDRLIRGGAKVDARGIRGLTAAWFAIRNEQKEAFAYLLAHGANPNPDVSAITIMEMAADREGSTYLRIALRYKPNLDLVGRATGNTPIVTAIDYNRVKNLELLIKSGANLNVKAGALEYPILDAIAVGRYQCLYLLLNAGADPWISQDKGVPDIEVYIGNCHINPDSDEYIWRERVIRYLRTKGIIAHRPPRERKRTKPLPPDLQSSPD